MVEVPGFVTGVGPGVLLPPRLPDSVIDAITETPGLDLPSIELPLPGDTPEAGVPDEAPAVTAPATAPAPVSDTPAPASSSDHGDHEASAPVAESTTADTPQPAPRSEAVESAGSQDQTDTDASDEVRADETVDNDVPQDDEVTESLIDITTDVETGTGMDPIMAALLGMLGALGLMAIVTAAFRAGRKNS